MRDANAERLEAARRLIIPGLINSHTHSHGGLSKGDRRPLEPGDPADRQSRGSAANAACEDKHLSALITAVDHVEKGTTACYDLFFEFPAPSIDGMEAVANAYNKVGLRAVIAPMVADLTFYQSLPGLIDALARSMRGTAGALRMGGAGRHRCGTAAACRAMVAIRMIGCGLASLRPFRITAPASSCWGAATSRASMVSSCKPM